MEVKSYILSFYLQDFPFIMFRTWEGDDFISSNYVYKYNVHTHRARNVLTSTITSNVVFKNY